LQYFDQETNEGFVPYVVETSIGLDRTFLAVLSHAYREEKLDDGSDRVVLSLPAKLAPIKVAVLPLVKKDGLPEKARDIMDTLKFDYRCFYEEKDTIGRRYRRMDALGTPFAITIDHQTLQDNTVTIRDRDTMMQDRIAVGEISGIVKQKLMNS
jgi:glycyl-tRNA synthetase